MRTNKLGLTLPEQTNNKPTIDLSVEGVEKWRSHLQTADTGETAHNVFTMLKEMNSTIIPPTNRFQVLELLRPLSQVIFQLLKKHYVNRTQPLSPKKLNIVELSRILQTEMLNSYKIIIEDIANDPSATLKTEILPNAIYRALRHFNNILSSYYQLYSEQPANIWKEMHILYKYALDCKIAENPITLEIMENNKNLVATTPYKHAIFLASIHPYQWRQSEQEMLYKYANLWDEFITIRSFKSKDRTENSGIIFIPINEDLSPFPITIKKTTINDSGLILDLSNLVSYLKTNINNLKNISGTETAIEIYSLQKLASYIIGGPTRKMERFNIIGQVSAAFGALSTHYHINQRRLFKPENVGTDTPEDSMQELNSDLSLDDALSSNSNTEQEFKADTFLYKCKLMNIHGEGAGISFQDISFPPIQPGEIVAMTIASSDGVDLDETHWNIGTICWLKHDAQNKLIAGIKILAPFAIAAAVQLLKDGNGVGYFQRALLFQDHTETFNLITPIMQFETGKTVKIYSYYHKIFVETELKKQVDANNNFKCFIVNINLNPSNVEIPKINAASIVEPAKEDATVTSNANIWKDL